MLELKNITKIYPMGGETIEALKGISLQFRKCEFVSILGPSGCGKTTMLNIIGGLDKYTTGDLVINGVSTKEYKDRDWDAYRNHSVGFVFQTYNLIPHQSVLQNVELALTLSGVSKKERRKRAKEALERVGLGDQLRKKPNEMSGGQMQRVAIARAIVNDPDIVLADEPTGALDTETSLQVMEILKEISRDRLVVMVTHNPELAERYSTRIVRMLDGVITADSGPLSEAEINEEAAEIAKKTGSRSGRKKAKVRKPSMSLGTSFGLSLKNLFTKKGRTALTSFAGSIGIIGIALIYAVSQGMTMYINAVQEDTLSSYPLTIEAKTVDLGSLLETFMGKAQSIEKHENDAVYQKAMFYEMMNTWNSMEEKENDLRSFGKYIQDQRATEGSPMNQAISAVQYTYDTDLLVYTKNVDGDVIISDTRSLLSDLMAKSTGVDMQAMARMQSRSIFGPAMMQTNMRLWQELLTGDGELINPLVKNQYDVVYGRWPQSYDEIMLFVDERNELDDFTLYALGLKSEDEMNEIMDAAINGETIDYEIRKWTYSEICSMPFRVVLSADCYSYDEATGTYDDLRDTQTGLKYLYSNGLDLHVVGIARPSEDAISNMVTGSIGYTRGLTEYIIKNTEDSPAVVAQLEDKTKDIFTGLPFKDNDKNLSAAVKAEAFLKYVEELGEDDKAEAYLKILSIPDAELVEQTVSDALAKVSREDIEEQMRAAVSAQMSVDEEALNEYITNMSDEDIEELFRQMTEEQFRLQYASGVRQKMARTSAKKLAAMLDAALEEYGEEECADYYDDVLEFSDSTYDDNIRALGLVDIDSPSTINLYATTFANKDVIEEAIAAYNETVDEMREIEYTDYVGIIMSSVTTIINAITYVLIAFVAVSLVVSSIMIGVITLISVQERTKEIGILRAIGASKKNVSSMFNAETVMIGLTSGILGVLITYLLEIPINSILHKLTNISNLNAYLPPAVAAILVGISVLLTLIAGIIPSRSAARKDPVVALRTE